MFWMIVQSWLNSVPLTAWVVIVVVALAVLYAFFAPFFTTIWAITPKWLKWTIGILTFGLATWAAGRNTGAKNEKAIVKAQNAQAEERRDKADVYAKAVPSSDLDRELGKYGGLRDE